MIIAALIGLGASFGVRAQIFQPPGQFPAEDTPFFPQQFSSGSSSSFSFSTAIPGQSQTSFLACMQAAEARKEQAAVQLYAWMYQQKTLARQRQAELRVAAWNIADDRERRRVQREIDRAYRDALRGIDDAFDDVGDAVLDRYRDERRACDRLEDDDNGPALSSSRSSSSFSQWWEPFSSSSFPSNPSSQSGFFVPGVIGGGIGRSFP